MEPDDIRINVSVGGVDLFSASLAELRLLRRFSAYMDDLVLAEIGDHLKIMFHPDD